METLINLKINNMANPIKNAINKTWEERKMWWDFFGGLPLLLNYNKP
jgi:hypothetical protein